MKVMQIFETPKGLCFTTIGTPRAETRHKANSSFAYALPESSQPNCNGSPPRIRPDGSPRKHAIPAHEFSGDVCARGDGVEDIAVGESIFGMNDWYQEGALAEYCVAPATSVAYKPKSLSYEQAATVPIGALTAWQGLTTHGHLRSGERVLIHGGAGGVGLFAVQFAKSLGAHVIATAAAATIPLVKKLGADEVIDYRGATIRPASPRHRSCARHRRRRNAGALLECPRPDRPPHDRRIRHPERRPATHQRHLLHRSARRKAARRNRRTSGLRQTPHLREKCRFLEGSRARLHQLSASRTRLRQDRNLHEKIVNPR